MPFNLGIANQPLHRLGADGTQMVKVMINGKLKYIPFYETESPKMNHNIKPVRVGDVVHLNDARPERDPDYKYYYRVMFKSKRTKMTLHHIVTGKRLVINDTWRICDNLGNIEVDVELEKLLYERE